MPEYLLGAEDEAGGCPPSLYDPMEFENVMETFSLHDTVLVCEDYYGNEKKVQGWFDTMADFGAEREHSFFKGRNQALCSLAYNNMKAQDRADYPMHIVSIGVKIFGPVSLIESSAGTDATLLRNLNAWWQCELQNHLLLKFKTGEDVRLEAPVSHAPPGYGAQLSGVTQGQDVMCTTLASVNHTLTQAAFTATNGVPIKDNRYIVKSPIEIPRNEVFEVIITVGEPARQMLTQLSGPSMYVMATDNAGETPDTSVTFFPCRYGIQVSLYGMREVMQRGQLHF